MYVKFSVSNSTIECETPVVKATRWRILPRATGGTRRRERVKCNYLIITACISMRDDILFS